MVPEKNVTEFFCDADADDRSDPYMSPPLKRAGDTINEAIKLHLQVFHQPNTASFNIGKIPLRCFKMFNVSKYQLFTILAFRSKM